MGLMHFFPRTTATCLGFAFFPMHHKVRMYRKIAISKNLSAYAAPSPKVNFQKVLSIPGIESSFQASFVINVPSQTLLFQTPCNLETHFKIDVIFLPQIYVLVRSVHFLLGQPLLRLVYF